MNNTEIKLLVDGAAAFPEILQCIESAHSSILINMFIWRDDAIGIRLAEAVLRAAERGVRVNISVDRVGMVLECCEESERSFFHRRPSALERAKIAVLKLAYPKNRGKAGEGCASEGLRERLLSHPNVTVDKDRQKNDHSKYYVIDGHILIFGGINVEDKECGTDSAGRVYQDYMLKMESEDCVRAFLHKVERNQNTADGYFFRMNNKTVSPYVFEMKERFLSVINGAQSELVIVMAYFAPIREIVDAIVRAWRRGVRISIMIPENANFQNNCNRRTVRILMKRCNNEIRVMLSPKMVHTKLIVSENVTMLGSCNITSRAFYQLGELDVELENDASPIIKQIRASVEENLSLSHPVADYRQIGYSPFIAFIESSLN